MGALADQIDGFDLLDDWWEKDTRALAQRRKVKVAIGTDCYGFTVWADQTVGIIRLNPRFFIDNLNTPGKDASSRYHTIVHEAIHLYADPTKNWMGSVLDPSTPHGRVDALPENWWHKSGLN